MMRFLAGLGADTGWAGLEEAVVEGGVGDGVEVRDKGPLEFGLSKSDSSELLSSDRLNDSLVRELGLENEEDSCMMLLEGLVPGGSADGGVV